MLLTAIEAVDRDTECCYWRNTCFSDGYVMLLANFEACRIGECGGVEEEVGRFLMVHSCSRDRSDILFESPPRSAPAGPFSMICCKHVASQMVPLRVRYAVQSAWPHTVSPDTF